MEVDIPPEAGVGAAPTRGPAAPASPSLLVVIVNYRTPELAVDCLRSLEGEVAAGLDVGVVVTDNASGDGSAERLERAVRDHGWSRWAAVRALGRNGGFAWGNNEGMRAALASGTPPRYVLLLNSDTIVRPGALAALVAFMDEHPGVGIGGSRLEDMDGTCQRSAFRFPSVLGELEGGLRLGVVSRLLSRWVVAPPPPESTCRTDWVAGASMIIRREVFDAVGLLDDSYFMYYEEVDFCRRAATAGWPCWYVPESRVVHLVGKSSGVTDREARRRRMPAYWFRSRRRYFLAHHGVAGSILADLAWASSYATFRVRRVLQRKPDHDPEKMLADFLRFNFLLPVLGRR